MKSKTQDIKPIALRMTDSTLLQRVEALASEMGLSNNMTVNMLLGFAFNEIDRQGRDFVPKVVFEAGDTTGSLPVIDFETRRTAPRAKAIGLVEGRKGTP